MTQEERRIYLIRELQKQMPEYQRYEIPQEEETQCQFLRGLFNLRPVMPVSEEFLSIQDEYLQERTKEKGITDASSLSPVETDNRLILWQGDITTLKCDAILNPANDTLSGCWIPNHSCADNIIQTFSGIQVRRDCVRYMEEKKRIYGEDYLQPTSLPMITKAYNLPSRYIIHVVGPIVTPYLKKEHKDQLKECYKACLDLASEYHCQDMAFCCLSTGVFMFPPEKAAEIAVSTVKEWLDNHKDSSVRKVIFNVFKDSDLKIYRKLLGTMPNRVKA